MTHLNKTNKTRLALMSVYFSLGLPPAVRSNIFAQVS